MIYIGVDEEEIDFKKRTRMGKRLNRVRRVMNSLGLVLECLSKRMYSKYTLCGLVS